MGKKSKSKSKALTEEPAVPAVEVVPVVTVVHEEELHHLPDLIPDLSASWCSPNIVSHDCMESMASRVEGMTRCETTWREQPCMDYMNFDCTAVFEIDGELSVGPCEEMFAATEQCAVAYEPGWWCNGQLTNYTVDICVAQYAVSDCLPNYDVCLANITESDGNMINQTNCMDYVMDLIFARDALNDSCSW